MYLTTYYSTFPTLLNSASPTIWIGGPLPAAVSFLIKKKKKKKGEGEGEGGERFFFFSSFFLEHDDYLFVGKSRLSRNRQLFLIIKKK